MITLPRHIQELRPILSQHARETGYSEQVLYYGFSQMFAHWNLQEFEAFLTREIPGFQAADTSQFIDGRISSEQRRSLLSCKTVSSLIMVTASTVPSASFQDIMLSLLLPVRITHRPSRHLVPLFESIRNWVAGLLPDFASRWTITPTDHDAEQIRCLLASHDAVNISGSDQTIAHYQNLIQELPADARPKCIAHGHRISAIIIRSHELNSLTQDDYDRISIDASIWDQTGCLSPKCIFIEGSPDECIKFAQNLLHSLDKTASLLPEIPPSPCDLAARNNAILMAQIDGAKVIRATQNHDILIVYPQNSPFHPVLFPRTTTIWPVGNALKAAMQLSPHGQCLASASPINDEEIEELSGTGFNRFCAFGKMQDPPLTWFHDGIGTIAPLIK